MMLVAFLGIDILYYLCWVGVLLFCYCFPIWAPTKYGGFRFSDREGFFGLVDSHNKWRRIREMADGAGVW